MLGMISLIGLQGTGYNWWIYPRMFGDDDSP